MWIIVLEMVLALGLAVFIVWWTMFYKVKPKAPASDQDASGGQPPAQSSE